MERVPHDGMQNTSKVLFKKSLTILQSHLIKCRPSVDHQSRDQKEQITEAKQQI